jgi:glycosyltransferase involved in cell wall biosynthesis
MKIAILLPFKDTYTKDKAGSASIWVKDFIKNSRYKKNISIFGHIKNLKKDFLIDKKKYKNIDYNFDYYVGSKNKKYVQLFNSLIKKKKINLVEIHNRPSYLQYLDSKLKKTLIFHNDPLTLKGSISFNERINIINSCEKIIFVSNWVKERFFEGFKNKNNNKCLVVYPSINKLKKFPKKENLIIFVGKLNRSKGYKLFGEAIQKILKEFKNWSSVVIGDEPREKYNFEHKNLKLTGWLNHNDTLKFYEKSKIAVSPSLWEEPFGRTSMEAGSRGCATIISNRGGITETNLNSIILEKLTADEIYKNIKYLIKNPFEMKKIQKDSFLNVVHELKANCEILDDIRDDILNNFKINIIRNRPYKIIHISNFGNRQANRLYNISIAKKISNGLIRNGHDVINISDRDVVRFNRGLRNLNKGLNYFNNLLLETIDNYKPDALILGHVNNINIKTFEKIKKLNKNLKMAQWFEDNLSINGPDPDINYNNFTNYIEFLDHSFVTSDPKSLKLDKKFKCSFMPIPVDENIEYLECYKNKNPIKDVFFTMSHGVNKGVLRKNKVDVREPFVSKLISKNKNIVFDIYGYKNKQPIWASDFYDALYKSKMALNLSRINNVKYYSSNRIASLIGNGILTFVDINTKLNHFFADNEVIFYKNLNDLSNKINYYKSNHSKRNEIARNGKKKYFKMFNNKIIAEFICSRLFNSKFKKLPWMR